VIHVVSSSTIAHRAPASPLGGQRHRRKCARAPRRAWWAVRCVGVWHG